MCVLCGKIGHFQKGKSCKIQVKLRVFIILVCDHDLYLFFLVNINYK